MGQAATNDARAPIDDAVLGCLTWVRVYESWTWSLVITLADASGVHAYTLSQENWEPLSGESLGRIRALVRWLRANEPSLRDRVAVEMFEEWRADYWDPKTDGPPTPALLAARLKLIEVTFVPDGLAYLWYEFDSPAGPGIIRLGLDSAGGIAIKPGYPW